MPELKFMHIRRYGSDNPDEPLLKGGITIGYKANRKGTEVKVSVACCSKQDAYNKETGRRLVAKRMKRKEYQRFESLPSLPPGAVVEMLFNHGLIDLDTSGQVGL